MLIKLKDKHSRSHLYFFRTGKRKLTHSLTPTPLSELESSSLPVVCSRVLSSLGTFSGCGERTITITKLSDGNGFLAIPKCPGSQQAVMSTVGLLHPLVLIRLQSWGYPDWYIIYTVVSHRKLTVYDDVQVRALQGAWEA